MSYTKNIWATGDLVTAEKLNNLENGVDLLIGEQRTVLVPTYPGYIIDNNGKNGTVWKGLKSIYTPSFIKVYGMSEVALSVSSSCYVTMFFYTQSYALQSKSSATSLSANTSTTFQIPAGCYFIKFYCAKDTSISTNLYDITVNISGKFYTENIMVKNPGTSDVAGYGSYYSLAVTVNAGDLTTSNAEQPSASLKEDNNFLPDYGVLALPKTYSNDGKPTRLIIYTHGAGVHYSAGATRFDSGDYGCEPDYWLSEGYAVFDVEGDPFGNTHKAFSIPQGIQSYIEAYKFILNNFNICTDGVFVGGRSMGGLTCIGLLRQTAMPILACCPVAGTFNFFHSWSTITVAANRKFICEKYGIPGASSITYGTSTLTNDEMALYKNNFYQLAQCYPALSIINKLPTPEEAINPAFNVVSSTATPPEAEKNLYYSLSVKTLVPFKFFCSQQDTSVPYKRNSLYMYTMMRNGGSIAEIHIFPTGGHGFERESQNRISSYTNTKGITMNNVPITYIEMLKFWRRYELQ